MGVLERWYPSPPEPTRNDVDPSVSGALQLGMFEIHVRIVVKFVNGVRGGSTSPTREVCGEGLGPTPRKKFPHEIACFGEF